MEKPVLAPFDFGYTFDPAGIASVAAALCRAPQGSVMPVLSYCAGMLSRAVRCQAMKAGSLRKSSMSLAVRMRVPSRFR